MRTPKTDNPAKSQPPLTLIIILAATLILFSPDAASVNTTDPDENPPIIDSVVIDNQNIFPQDSAKYDYWFFRLANKLHVKSRKSVIRRELLLDKGDFFSRKLADETERNLRSLIFIWNAAVDLYRTDDSLNVMRVTTFDTWTLRGGLSIKRSAGETTYRFSIEEQNFLGMGQFISLKYFARNFDRDYPIISLHERRLFGSRYYAQAYYNDDPEVGLKGIIFGRPFYTLDTRFAFRFSSFKEKRRTDYYENGSLAARDHIRGYQSNLEAAYRFGTRHDKGQVKIYVQYRDMRLTSTEILHRPVNNFPFPVDSLYYMIAPELTIQNLKFIKTRRINSYSKIEDIALSTAISLLGGVEIDASSGHRRHRLAGILWTYSNYINSNLFFVTIMRNSWFRDEIDFRNQLQISIKYYNNGLSWLTPAIRLIYDSDRRKDGSKQLYLGENNGLRGYAKNYSTGDRRLLGNIENRFFTGIQFLSVDFGAVQFFDIGQSWDRNEGLKWDNFLWSAGLGLRFGIEKVSSTGIMRVDLAYAGRLKEWQWSFGLGHYFE